MGPPQSSLLLRSFSILFTSIALILLGLWGVVYWGAEDTTPLQRDWRCLWDAGRGFLDGQWDQLYAARFSADNHDGICQPGYFWLYPPPALYLSILPALFTTSVAYPLFMATVYGCFAGSLLLIQRLYTGARADSTVFALGALASAPMSSVVITGQNSALLLLAFCAAIVLLRAGQWVGAALALSVFLLKPNWLPLMLCWLVFRADWKVIGGLILAGLVMMLSTAPLGLELWVAFQQSSLGYGQYVLEHYPVDKLITTHAALRSLSVPSNSLTVLWGLSLVAGLACCWSSWRSHRSMMAQAGVTLLATVCCNVYTNFYDALVLIFPAAVWWFEREEYSQRIWVGIATILGLSWCWTWVNYVWSQGHSPGHLGFLLFAWLLAEGYQSWLRR